MKEVMDMEFDKLLTTGEVAAAFRVDAKTVRRWANDGRLTVVRTLGNHRRFNESEIRALLVSSTEERAA